MNPFLEPTSTKLWGLSFLLKETTGAFIRTHDWPISHQTCYHCLLLVIIFNVTAVKRQNCKLDWLCALILEPVLSNRLHTLMCNMTHWTRLILFPELELPAVLSDLIKCTLHVSYYSRYMKQNSPMDTELLNSNWHPVL